MTSEQLTIIAGIILSLLCSYLPGVNDAYNNLSGIYKRLVMLFLLLIVSISVFILSCTNLYMIVPCDKAGALGLIESFIAALVANQSTYLITPKLSFSRTHAR